MFKILLKLRAVTVFITMAFFFGVSFRLNANEASDETETTIIMDDDFSDNENLTFEEKSDDKPKSSSFLYDFILQASRLSLLHEGSYKVVNPDGIRNNRSSVRLEYSKFFLNNFYLQFDTKLNAYWIKDHRAEAQAKDILLESKTKEAFLQISFANTSIKAGIQVLIWGVSEGGAITDVISPRDYTELFCIPLDESRIGQLTLAVDQFTSIGEWGFFFIPFPEFNDYPKKKTAYYYDPFSSYADYQTNSTNRNLFEYGLRWKKTFGKSDVSLMAANLIANDYAYRLKSMDLSGNMLINRAKRRFLLGGMTFNYALGNFLFRGEFAYKTPQAFNDGALQIVDRDVIDTSVGVSYSPGGTLTFSLEGVNKHIVDYANKIEGFTEDSYTVIFIVSDSFFNDYLSLTWMSFVSGPYFGSLHMLQTFYKLSDNLTVFLDLYYPYTPDPKSLHWVSRDQKLVAMKVQYQF